MITICNEEYQEKYNITNGCWCCGTKELTEDIKEVQFVPGSMSKTITLCKKCRNELLNVLKEHDGAMNDISENIETKENTSNDESIEDTDDYSHSDMERIPGELSEEEDWPIDTIVDDDFDVEAWVNSLNESNQKEKYDTELSDIENNGELLEEENWPIGLVIDEEPDFDVEAWVNSLIEQNEKEKADTELSSIMSNAVEKVLNPEIPETVAGQKLPMLTVARINPVIFMCKNCEMDYDDEDVEFAKETGDCPYCNVDLTEEYDPDAMLVGKSSLHRL